MLMEVKNQIKVSFLSIKYCFIRESLNKVTFFSNIIFMILNNTSMIVQWIVLFSLKSNFGGYTFKKVLLLWGLAASTYGFAHFFFKNSFRLSENINLGKLDVYLVMPKDVLLTFITSDVRISALGDIIFGYGALIIYGADLLTFSLFTLFSITGAIIITAFAIILGSLSFYFSRSDAIVDNLNSMMVNFATYPDSIFKGFVHAILYTIIPVGLYIYIPVSIMSSFNIGLFLIIIGFTMLIGIGAYKFFYKGLHRYSSSNLMNART